MPSPIITLTTDFGLADHYAGVMKGVILGLCPQARIVDLTHQLPPQQVIAAAWTILDSANYFPKNTIHLAVVDPGVGTERRPIALRARGQFFVGPDNGVFSPFLPPDKAVVLNRPAKHLPRVSDTFHGRDIFAPAAARLARGEPLEELGDEISDPVAIALPQPKQEGRELVGEVVAVDRFGNLLTNLPAAMIPDGAKAAVEVGECLISGVRRTYGEAKAGELIALIGSADRLEIARVNGSAQVRLKARVGDRVRIMIKGKTSG